MKITLTYKDPNYNAYELNYEKLVYDCSSYSVGLGGGIRDWESYKLKFLALLYSVTCNDRINMGHNKFVFSYTKDKIPTKLFKFLKGLGAKRKTIVVPGWIGNPFCISVVTIPKSISKWKYNPFAEQWPENVSNIKVFLNNNIMPYNTWENFSWLSDVKVGGN